LNDIEREPDYQQDWEVAYGTLVDGVDMLERFSEAHEEILPEDSASYHGLLIEAIHRLDRIASTEDE
jgi:hypothetical protein